MKQINDFYFNKGIGAKFFFIQSLFALVFQIKTSHMEKPSFFSKYFHIDFFLHLITSNSQLVGYYKDLDSQSFSSNT